MYSSDEDKLGKYNRWADSYETDLVNDLDYVAHIDAAKIFSEVVENRKSRVLDVACGTGLVGETLLERGYRNVDGTDFSEEMLKISRHRKVYQELIQHDFTLPFPLSDPYDSIICVGLFSFSIPGMKHLINVVNAVKPGHHCVITVNGAAWRELNLEEALEYESRKHGFIVEEIIQAGYIQKENIDSRVLIIRSPD